MKDILIITWTPITRFSFERVYGFNDLENDFNLTIFDVSRLIFKTHLHNLYDKRGKITSISINSYNEINKYIRKKDFKIIINLTGIWETHLLYKEIIKKNIPIINLINSPLFKDYFYPKKILNYLKYISKFLTTNIIPLSKNFIGGRNFNNYYNSIKSEIFYSHSLNYNEYLINRRFIKKEKKSKKIISFIDSGFKFHPDFYLNKNRKIDKNKNFNIKKFSKKINKLFKDFADLGYEINFLSHPKIKKKHQKIYMNCNKVYSKTLEYIKKSDIVICCGSSTIEHAILFKKPILIIDSKEIDAYPVVKRNIKLHNKFFEKKAFDLGLYKSIYEYEQNLILPSSKYREYFDMFIKHPKSKNYTYSNLIRKLIKNNNEN